LSVFSEVDRELSAKALPVNFSPGAAFGKKERKKLVKKSENNVKGPPFLTLGSESGSDSRLASFLSSEYPV
jgi:hypothetical protein